jgi:DNA-binding NarL/FixJ family response regulator
MRVLIADNSALVRERLTYLLADLKGVEIAGQAKDALEARSLAKRLKPDVAILDVAMPKGIGSDVLIDVKKVNPSAKVIVLTNDAYPEIRNKCFDEGADYFFDKSTEFQKVVSVLKDMIPGSGKK